jgi:hypothetical protein
LTTNDRENANSQSAVVRNPEQVTIGRLDEEIRWYDSRSRLNRFLFKTLKTTTMASAAVIPVVTTSGVQHGTQLAAALGILIALLEAIQELNQYRTNWTNYRATAEALKQEKYLFLGGAGAYLGAENARVLLAEKIETLISKENAQWLARQIQHSGTSTTTR